MNNGLIKTIMLIVGLVLSGCGVDESLSGLNEVNEGKRVSYAPDGDQKKTVFIYYGNESYYGLGKSEDKYNRVLDALENVEDSETDLSTDEKAYFEKVASGLKNDTSAFGNAVDDEIGAIWTEACDSSSDLDVAFVAINNLYVSEHRAFYSCDSKTHNFTTHGFEVKDLGLAGVDRFPYKTHPLSHPGVFKAVLENIKTAYPANTHKYILVTKSHGTTEMAMIPKLLIDLDEGQQVEFRRELRKYRRANRTEKVSMAGRLWDLLASTVLFKDVLSKDILSKDVLFKDILSKDVLAKDILSKDILSKDVLDKDVLAKDVLDKDLLAKDVLAKDILAKDVLAKDILAKDILAKDVLAKDVLAKDLLAKDLLAKDLLSKGNLGDILFDEHRFGVTKRDYIRVLRDSGMDFSLVFMESCKSALELSEDKEIQDQLSSSNGSYAGLSMKNVGYIFTSDKNGLDYHTVNYGDVFKTVNSQGETRYSSKTVFGELYSRLSNKAK